MRDQWCDVCSVPFDGQPAYLVKGARWIRRRWHHEQLLVCQGCHSERRGYWNDDHKKLAVYWFAVVGRGQLMPPAPCVHCGQRVIRNADPLLKRVTCSHGCSTDLTRSRNGNAGSGEPCEACGNAITTGRADSRYCSPKCRQKAYRQRKSHAQP